jgi:DNA-binding NarL/FixJ family response regulator
VQSRYIVGHTLLWGFVLAEAGRSELPDEERTAFLREVAEIQNSQLKLLLARLIDEHANELEICRVSGGRSHERVKRLTEREREVFTLLREGQTNPQIAVALHVSSETVKSHVASVLSKLDLKNRRELIDNTRRVTPTERA